MIFKPRIDDRYDAADVVSHAGIRMRAVPVSTVSELVARARGFDVVGIDEVQFFEHSVVASALELAEGGVRSSPPGSTRTSGACPSARCRSCSPRRVRRQAAGRVPPLRRAGDDDAAARGRPPAPYSGETVLVGAAEQYEARCRGCHEAGLDAPLLVAA